MSAASSISRGSFLKNDTISHTENGSVTVRCPMITPRWLPEKPSVFMMRYIGSISIMGGTQYAASTLTRMTLRPANLKRVRLYAVSVPTTMSMTITMVAIYKLLRK